MSGRDILLNILLAGNHCEAFLIGSGACTLNSPAYSMSNIKSFHLVTLWPFSWKGHKTTTVLVTSQHQPWYSRSLPPPWGEKWMKSVGEGEMDFKVKIPCFSAHTHTAPPQKPPSSSVLLNSSMGPLAHIGTQHSYEEKDSLVAWAECEITTCDALFLKANISLCLVKVIMTAKYLWKIYQPWNLSF